MKKKCFKFLDLGIMIKTIFHLVNTWHILLKCNFFDNPFLGFTGGSHRSHKGAAVEPLCLPRNPEWGMYTDGHEGYKAYVYGAEYETSTFKGNIQTVHNHDIPCAVCLVHQRSVVQMFLG